MCKFCNVEPGDMKDIDTYEMINVVGGNICGNEKLSVHLYANDEDTPDYYLVTQYTLNNGEFTKAVIETPIRYCPFCGEKLHNKLLV